MMMTKTKTYRPCGWHVVGTGVATAQATDDMSLHISPQSQPAPEGLEDYARMVMHEAARRRNRRNPYVAG